ncbi:MAG: hypothetical protein HN366_05655 [Deltaproteobacteria bacterium]|jgi:hypothetical protein|nr:hypothetical protein [Deltaproteobacteria bacterium]
MISTHKTIPSEKGKEILKTLKKTAAETLERKRKLGHYVVVWDGKKPVQRGDDAPIVKG